MPIIPFIENQNFVTTRLNGTLQLFTSDAHVIIFFSTMDPVQISHNSIYTPLNYELGLFPPVIEIKLVF